MLLVRTRWGPVCMTGSLRGRHARNGKDSDYASDSDEEYMTSSEFEESQRGSRSCKRDRAASGYGLGDQRRHGTEKHRIEGAETVPHPISTAPSARCAPACPAPLAHGALPVPIEAPVLLRREASGASPVLAPACHFTGAQNIGAGLAVPRAGAAAALYVQSNDRISAFLVLGGAPGKRVLTPCSAVGQRPCTGTSLPADKSAAPFGLRCRL